MIVRTLKSILGTERDVHAATWNSRRLLLKSDRMGFSMHDTRIHAGTDTRMCYRHHLEAVYCVAGEGSVQVIGTGERFEIAPGTLYALDGHEEHVLSARTELHLVCVFNPPLTGAEVHDVSGAYPPDAEAGA